MTPEQRRDLGVPIPDPNDTPHPTPTQKPETEAVPSGKGRHTVTAINPDSHDKKRPQFATGVAFAHKLRLPTEPQSKAKEMPSEYQTPPIRDFQWEQDDYGKVADYATAYEKDGGPRGPWSDVVSEIIA
jgi:hypothetical protein